eukprot:318433_1
MQLILLQNNQLTTIVLNGHFLIFFMIQQLNYKKKVMERWFGMSGWRQKRFRYAFLVDPHDPYNLKQQYTNEEYNNLIFKMCYNSLIMFRYAFPWGYDILTKLQCTAYSHLKVSTFKERKKCQGTYEREPFKKYFNFVEYEWINEKKEIETLYWLDTTNIIQEVIYERNITNTKLLCYEKATRIRYNMDQSVNITQVRHISYAVNCVEQCLFREKYSHDWNQVIYNCGQ